MSQEQLEKENITLDILVPETNSEEVKEIINAKQRDCVFRGIYILLLLKKKNNK